MLIRPIRPSDALAWEAMRRALWPDGAEEHASEIAAFFAGTSHEPHAVLVVEDHSGSVVAVAELSIRDDVSGLQGKRTGYVEGLYIVPEYRGRGLARKLLHAARTWARVNRCATFASDRADRIVIDKNF